jgi:hypothetical protein
MEIKFILLNSGNSTITGATALTSEIVEQAIAGQYATATQLPIVYIEDKQKIYLDGVFYGTSNSDISAIQATLLDHESRITANATAIDNVLSPAVDALQTAVGATTDAAASDGSLYARIAQVISDLSAEVSAREGAISDLETDIQGYTVNGESFGASGAITIDANEIKIGSTVPSITNITSNSTITDALNQLKTDINNVASGLTAESTGASSAAAAALAEAQLHTQVTAGTGITITVDPINREGNNTHGSIYTVSMSDIVATKADVTAAEARGVSAAVAEVVGATADEVTALTIHGARNYAKSLVDALSEDLSGVDEETLALLNRIKEEILNPSSADGMTSVVDTFLDKLMTVGAGFNGIDGGTEGATGTIKEYIDANVTALSQAISAAQSGADDSIKVINGLTGDANGEVTVGATDILMTDYAAATGAVASTDSVLTAVAKVEQHAIDAVNDAATAQSTANTAIGNAATAQSTADQAMGLLTWVII